MDELAAGAVFFEDTHSQANNTNPSHASIFTSLYMSTHGILGNKGYRLSPQAVTLAEVLEQAGYQTAGFTSIRHLSFELNGLDQGFEFHSGPPTKADQPRGILKRFSRRKLLSTHSLKDLLKWNESEVADEWGRYLNAVTFLESALSNRSIYFFFHSGFMATEPIRALKKKTTHHGSFISIGRPGPELRVQLRISFPQLLETALQQIEGSEFSKRIWKASISSVPCRPARTVSIAR